MRFKKIMTLALAGALSASAFALTGCGGEKKLWQYYEDYFKIGCTMNYGTQAQYDDIAGEFNSMTCENEMKWEALEPPLPRLAQSAFAALLGVCGRGGRRSDDRLL